MTPDIPFVPEGTLDPAAGLNLSLNVLKALVQTRVTSMSLTAPPGSPSDDDMFIVASPATGEWEGEELNLARYTSEGDFWTFYEAGTDVNLVYDEESGGIYVYQPGSSPSWVLGAGLGDAPADGSAYFRRNASWEAFTAGINIQNTEETAEEVETIIVDTGLESAVDSSGAVRLRAVGAPVVDYSDENLDADESNAGIYYRLSHATAVFAFAGDVDYIKGHEYHARYVGSGTLTLASDSGFTLNAPAGGSLEVPPGGTVTIKIVAADEADVMGVTV